MQQKEIFSLYKTICPICNVFRDRAKRIKATQYSHIAFSGKKMASNNSVDLAEPRSECLHLTHGPLVSTDREKLG